MSSEARSAGAVSEKTRQLWPKAVACAALSVYAAACGPEATDVAEPQAWMLGTFTATPPGEYLDIGKGYREVILEDGAALTQEVSQSGERQVAESVWRAVDESAFNLYDNTLDDTRWWEVTQGKDCSILELKRNGEDGLLTHSWYRGTICYESLTQPCPPDQAQCGTKARLYWCEEPPPCDEE